MIPFLTTLPKPPIPTATVQGDNAEAEAGTDPNNDDSDNDGLKDGEEVYIYDTNPLNNDTDGDGITDGNEVSEGSDPTEFDLPLSAT